MTSANELLQEGIKAAKAKKADEAFALLSQVTEMEPRNEMAWLWLSAVVETDEERVVCLQNVLALNPHNSYARKGLTTLNRRAAAIKPLPKVIDHPADAPPLPRQSDEQRRGKRCPRCDSVSGADSVFCTQCGAEMAVPARLDVASEPIAKAVTGGPAPSVARPSSTTNAVDVTIIALLVILGLFWLGVGCLQLALGSVSIAYSGTATSESGELVCYGIWNLLISVVNLLVIRDVLQRYRRTVRKLTFLAIAGSLFGFAQIVLIGAWIQVLVVPLYIALGVLAQANKAHFTELTPKEQKKERVPS